MKAPILREYKSFKKYVRDLKDYDEWKKDQEHRQELREIQKITLRVLNDIKRSYPKFLNMLREDKFKFEISLPDVNGIPCFYIVGNEVELYINLQWSQNGWFIHPGEFALDDEGAIIFFAKELRYNPNFLTLIKLQK